MTEYATSRQSLLWHADDKHYPDPVRNAMAKRILELERENIRLKSLVDVDHEQIMAAVEQAHFHLYEIHEIIETAKAVGRCDAE